MSKIRLILQFGLKLVRLAPLYVAAYVLLNLISQTAIPLMLPVLIGKLTNSVQPAAPAAGKTSAPQTQNSGAAAKPTTA